MREFEPNLRTKLSPIYLAHLGLAVLLGCGPLFLLADLPMVLGVLCFGIGLSFLTGGYLCRRHPEWSFIVTTLGNGVGLCWTLLVGEIGKSSGFIGAETPWMGLMLVLISFFGGLRQTLTFGVAYLFASQLFATEFGSSNMLSPKDFSYIYWFHFVLGTAVLIYFLLRFVRLSADVEREKINKTHQMLANAGSLRRGLYGGIAHEINNPLQIINGSASKISRLTFESEKDRKDALLLQHKVVSASQMIGLFVKSLHSKIESGSKSGMTHFVLSESIEKILIELGLIADTMVDGDAQLEVYTHRESLEQIVRALCQNAKEAAPVDQMANIKLNFRSNKGHIEVVVSDYGEGIQDEHHRSIFDPFFTTRSYNLHLGIGLSQSRAAAEQLKGTLELISPSNPTLFRLLLPQEKWDI